MLEKQVQVSGVVVKHISKEDDFANVSSNLATKANGNSKITRKKEKEKMR